MKHIFIVLILFFNTYLASAQSFTGGISNGFDVALYTNNLSAFYGGNTDGYGSTTYTNSITSFFGGNTDGFSVSTYSNNLTGAFSGGNTDGFSYSKFTNTLYSYKGGSTDGFSVEVFLNSGTLSVDEENLYNNFTIYPNPTQKTIYLNLPKNFTQYTVRVYNITGKVVLECENKTQLSLANLSTGIYFIKILDTVLNKTLEAKIITTQ